MPNVTLETDSAILDWIAEYGVVDGAFVLDETPTEDSEPVTIDYYAVQNNITVKQAIREVLSIAMQLDLKLQQDEEE